MRRVPNTFQRTQPYGNAISPDRDEAGQEHGRILASLDEGRQECLALMLQVNVSY